jgi:hypothetical protein
MKNSILLLCVVALFFRCSQSHEDADQKSAVEITPKSWTEGEIFETQQAPTGEVIAFEDAILDQNAINEVELFLNGGSGCGSRPGCGKWEYLRNKSSSRRINATVKTSWKYQNQNRTETKTYTLESGQEIFLGCTAWCSEMGGRQDFKREIVGASYL